MRRRGFTVVELLVVVAIIGALAAMVLPVFVQAREEARAKGCFANVWKISQAIRMYAADNDQKLFPGEHDPYVRNYFSSHSYGSNCTRAYTANPYLRVPVILSSYLPRPQVWQCPRAKVESHASWIVPPGPDGNWLWGYMDNLDKWGYEVGAGPCYDAWPSGWGGGITDSFAQGMAGKLAPDPNAFAESIAPNEALTDLTLNEVSHPRRYIAVGDYGCNFAFWNAEGPAFPDTCAANACGEDDGCPSVCAFADWVNCPESAGCGLTPEAHAQFLSSKLIRYRHTRHSGGSNIGFLDGHAGWYSYRDLVRHSPPYPRAMFEGVCSCWIGSKAYSPSQLEE